MQDDPVNALSICARVSYPDFRLNVDCTLALDGVTGLFGPSGSGKSTLLRIIAGFERNARGRVAFGGLTWQDSSSNRFVKAYKRPVGFVFQDARLFEHLTVDGNLRFAASRNTPHDSASYFDDVVASFDLNGLLHRRVNALSGGERQRVAIARTLLTHPRLLLLDEPLAALDASRKGEILPYLENLSRRFGIPTIYVSHAVDEIARLADQVVVLNQGEIAAIGGAAAILNRLDLQSPISQFEAITIMETVVTGHDADLKLTHLDLCGQQVVVPMLAGAKKGDAIRLHVRAGDVALATQKPAAISFRNILSGVVTDIEMHDGSAFATVSVDVNGTVLRAQLTRQAVSDLALATDADVYVLLKTASFDDRAPLP